MFVLFMRNPKTGEVKRVWAQGDESNDYAGWQAVNWQVWVDANADSLPVLPGSPLDARLQPTPAASTAADVATATEIEQSDIIDHVSSEWLMLQMAVAEALGLHRHALLDVDRDDIAEMISDLRAANEQLQAERDCRRVRILHLRRALKEIETTSGDGNSFLDAKEALEQDDALASKEAQASAPPADGEGGG